MIPKKLFIFICIISFITSAEKIEARIKVDAQDNWEIVYDNFSDTEHYVARAFYTNSSLETGWDKLSISTNPIFKDEIQAEGAGRLEAALTLEKIYYFHLNVKDSIPLTDNITKFFDEQEKFVMDSVEKGEGSQDPMLYNAYLIKIQYNAMIEQYNELAGEDRQLSKSDFHQMNYITDMSDVAEKFKVENEGEVDYTKLNDDEIFNIFLKRTHCSALFKLKNDLSDIYFGHNTWDSVTITIRMIKEYNFNFNNRWVRSKNIIFSSYPATLASLDDFYINSHGLISIETTNVLYNDSLYSFINPNSLFASDRAMICNRISNSSKEWAENYIKYNSGTYNNQFMILDKNKINLVNKSIDQDAFYISEAYPGIGKVNNVTDVLKFGYWSSYNVPYDKEIYDISGIKEVIEKNPQRASFLDYDIGARAKIFRRDHHTADNLEGFKKFIRYNNYKNDPFSEGNPALAISSRGDLNGSCSNAIDAKVGVLSEVIGKKIKIYLNGGPTYDKEAGIEPFEWATAPKKCSDLPHYLTPERYDFDWIEFENEFDF